MHAGTCRIYGSVDGLVLDNWNGADVEVGVGSGEEHSLMDFLQCHVQWSGEVGVWFSVVCGTSWWVV